MQAMILRTAKHDLLCALILRALREDGCIKLTFREAHIVHQASAHGTQLFSPVGNGWFNINLDEVLKVSHIIPNASWHALGDTYCRRQANRVSQGKSITPPDKWKGTRRGKDAPVKGKASQKRTTDTQELKDYLIFFSKED